MNKLIYQGDPEMDKKLNIKQASSKSSVSSPTHRFTLQPEKSKVWERIEKSYISSEPKKAFISEFEPLDKENHCLENQAKSRENKLRVCKKGHLDAYSPIRLAVMPTFASAIKILFVATLLLCISQILTNWDEVENLAERFLEFPTCIYIIIIWLLLFAFWKVKIELNMIHESKRIFKKLKAAVLRRKIVSKTDFDEVFYKSKYSKFRLHLLNKLFLYLQARIIIDNDLVLMRNETDIAYLTLSH
jgi:hypothetical protein